MKTPSLAGPAAAARVGRVAVTASLVLLLAACGHPTQRRTMSIALVEGRPGFVPQTVVVDKENPVVINVSNTTNATHGFSIDGYRVTRVIDAGQGDEVRFRASRGGTFRIYCQLHPMHQTATLVVR